MAASIFTILLRPCSTHSFKKIFVPHVHEIETKSYGAKQWRSHGGGGQSATSDSEKKCQKSGKEGKIRKNREERGKIGKKRQISGRFFHFPLLTDRAGCTLLVQTRNFEIFAKFFKTLLTILDAILEDVSVPEHLS